ncbi:OLC1v1006003C1 [Oldenlandia corymbosa var. corymbosa]|uniref:E3 ubiquitin protein ligase n=1 Tax=Oldenlandia corymbosa var. corymbosa TaxID=529605 RepID=A0AAV1DFY1_OLDCO|nr:OLC1v1006003C1 [Oldenlandia corymbosa var. corymbosa]
MASNDAEEPPKKRPHHDSTSPNSPKPVDAALLQYQNQKLVQQLDLQKQQLLDLEAKIKELKDKQASYGSVLTTVNRLWNQLEDELVLLGVRAGASEIALQSLDHIDQLRGSVPSSSAEDIFLSRLLQSNSVGVTGSDGYIGSVKERLSQRRSFARELMKSLEDAIEAQRAKMENIGHAFHGKPLAEDPVVILGKINDMMRVEVENLQKAMGIIQMKHKKYSDEIETCVQNNTADQSEIKQLLGDLEERMAELEDCRRKLVNLKMQKDGPSIKPAPVSIVANGDVSPEKPGEKTKRLRILKDSLEETKVLAEDRQAEVQEMQEDNFILLKQLQDLENELKEDKYVYSSRPYTLLNDQLQHWNGEVERYRLMADSVQAERSFIARKEKELTMKIESAEALRKVVENSETKIDELEIQLQKSVLEKNELEINLEEALQDSGRKDVKAEFQIMASALSKEMGMMEAQLNRWKETAEESSSLHEEVQSLKALVDSKTIEEKDLADKCAQQMVLIKSLKAYVEKTQKETEQLEIHVDMLSQQLYENRDLKEIRESEQKARAQAEILKNALDEHNLELRVKTAKEAEAACEERLATAASEKANLRAEVDACDRDVLKLREAIKIKEAEAEAYISEIETIGQAYEDMQMQNQRLLQQVAERDDYNIKLVSESVKAKQAHGTLLSEKQVLAKQLQRVNTTLESLKQKISEWEEQMKGCFEEASRYTEEDRQLAADLETSKRELVDAEKEVKWLKSAVASSEKENEQIERKKAELLVDLESERSARKKIQEEIATLNQTITDMTAESEEAEIQRLQDEIKECKAILKCGVCFDRPKEVLIAKCYHLFCNPCIQRNIEIRHRKCPACGTAFGQSDIKNQTSKTSSLLPNKTLFLPSLDSKFHSSLSPKSGRGALFSSGNGVASSTRSRTINATLLEAPVLWAGRVCIFYALLKAGLAGSPSSPLIPSDLETESDDLGFSQWFEKFRANPDKEATERRKLVSKWHPTTKGTLKRNYRVPSKSEGRRLLKAIASLLSDDDHFRDAASHKGCQIKRQNAHGESVCCNNVRALFDELPTPHLTIEITAFPAGPLSENDYLKAEKLERILRSGLSG